MREIENLIKLFKCIIEDAKTGLKNLKTMKEKRNQSIENNDRDGKNDKES